MSVTFSTVSGNGISALKIVSTTGTEFDSGLPAVAAGADGKNAPAAGLGLGGVRAVSVILKAATGTFAEGATLDAYIFDPVVREWTRCPDLDLDVRANLASQSFLARAVVASQGWLVYLPSGLGVGSTMHVNGYAVR